MVAISRKSQKDLTSRSWRRHRPRCGKYVLCVGIGEYEVLEPLPNAARDARALCDRVNALPRCRAKLLTDVPNSKAVETGIRSFLQEPGLQSMPPETVLVNYSGNGMQMGGHCVYAHTHTHTHTHTVLPGEADLDNTTCHPERDFLPIWDIFKWFREDLDMLTHPQPQFAPEGHVCPVLDACRVAEMDQALARSCPPSRCLSLSLSPSLSQSRSS